MRCADVVELVTDYLEDVLPPAERERFLSHLADCPGCAVYVDQIRGMSAELRGLDLSGLSDAGCAELLAAFRDWTRNN
jgi:anti-sigma factor RsiW